MQLTMFYKDQDILFFSKISDYSANRQRHEPGSKLKESLKTGTTFDSCENSLDYTVLWRSWLQPWTQPVPGEWCAAPHGVQPSTCTVNTLPVYIELCI
jgi:hypothetical protein